MEIKKILLVNDNYEDVLAAGGALQGKQSTLPAYSTKYRRCAAGAHGKQIAGYIPKPFDLEIQIAGAGAELCAELNKPDKTLFFAAANDR